MFLALFIYMFSSEYSSVFAAGPQTSILHMDNMFLSHMVGSRVLFYDTSNMRKVFD